VSSLESAQNQARLQVLEEVMSVSYASIVFSRACRLFISRKSIGECTSQAKMRTIMTVTLACNLIAAMCGCGFQLNGLPSNAIRVSPGSLTFGNVPVGRAVTSQLDVTNVSAETVVIADVSAGGQPFSVSSPAATPISIPAFGSHTFKIGFRPDKSMRYSGQLTLKDTSAKPIAEIPIAGAGTSDAVPQLAISASSLNFGSVIVNSVSTQAVTLTSTGTAPVTISGVSVTGTGFTVTGTTFPMTLNPSEPVTLQVQFQPTVAGTASGQLIVGSNSSTGGMATVALSGTGTAVSPSPQTSPQLAISASSFSFGNVIVNSVSTQAVTLTSTGTAAVTISGASVTGTGFTVTGATFPMTLNPSEAVTLQVQFQPTVAGTATGQLIIGSNSSSDGMAMVALSGTGTAVSPSPQTIPQLSLSASSLNFGSVIVNSVSTQAVTLTSTGTAAVTISGASVTGTGFTVTGATFPMTLNPSEAVTLQIQFQPTVAGTATGQLIVGSNSSSDGMAMVALSGTGTAVSPSPQTSPQLSLSASSLNFGSVIVNSVSTQAVTLTSTGTAPVTISSATLAGTGFTTSGLSLPVTLDPNLAVTLQIQFNPTAGGAAAGQLLIQSNSSSGSTVVVALSGTGVAALNPQLSVSASNLDFGSVPLNSVSTQSITLTSTGTSPVTISSAIPAGAGFTLSGASFPLMLDPGQATTLWAQFTPTTMGTATGQLTISSNSLSSSTIVVAFSGNGTSGSSQHVVDLRWNAPKGSLAQLAGYNIYRSSYGDSFQLLNQAPNLQTTYVDSTIESGVAYSYIVKSVDLSGMESDPTNEATVIVP